MKIDSVRKHALSLEAVTEEPHHNYSSFRVRGKIFATIPPEEEFIHVFVAEEDREPALAMYPDFIEKLLWGRQGRRIESFPGHRQTGSGQVAPCQGIRDSSSERRWATIIKAKEPGSKVVSAHPRARPNPSLNRTRYGKQRKPGLRHLVHHRSPGLRCSPPRSG